MNLTSQQKLAAYTIDKSIAVIAGAGSGKTRVLTQRIKHLISDNHFYPHQILAFTFTEKAASEIKHRLLSEIKLNAGDEAWFELGTMHGFCARFLKKYGPLIGLDPDFKIMTDADYLLETDFALKNYLTYKIENNDSTLSTALNHLGFQKLFGLCKNILTDPHLYRQKIQKDNASFEEALTLKMRKLFDLSLKKRMDQAHLSFQDLEILTVSLLKNNKRIQDKLQKKYQHILVDEFQDTNPIQGELIKLLYHKDLNKLFVVGDPKQSIYGFRRADVSIFKKMADQIVKDGGQIVSLSETFRIPKNLASHFNNFFSPLFKNEETSFFEPITSLKESDGNLRVLTHQKDKSTVESLRIKEAHFIANDILKNVDVNDYSKTALLFKSATSMSIYQNALNQIGISCRIAKTSNLLDNSDILNLTAILNYLVDKNKVSQIGILKNPYFNFSEDFIERYFKSQARDFLDNHFTLDLFCTEHDSQKFEELRRLIKKWTALKDKLKPASLITLILSDLKCHLDFLAYEEWLYLIGDLELNPHFNLKTISHLVKLVEKFGEVIQQTSIQSAENAVHLMTIHASKGLEFKHLYLPQLYGQSSHDSQDFILDAENGLTLKGQENLNQPQGLKRHLIETEMYLKLKERKDFLEKEESKRLLYVAMTRTQENLTLFLKNAEDKEINLEQSHNWNDWIWSLFKEKEELTETKLEIKNVVENKPATPSSHLIPNNNFNYKPTYTVSMIESAMRCEKEYALKYIHELQMTPFDSTLTHQNLSSLNWGILVHEVMEFLDFETFENRQEVIEQALTNQHIVDSGFQIKDKLISLIYSLKNNEEIYSLLKNQKSLQTETPFLLNCEDFFLKGTLDRLGQFENSWTVVDFKTDRIQKNQLEIRSKNYQGQMACYALALSKILNVDSVKTSLIFTEGPWMITQTWSKPELDNFENTLKKLHQNIIQKRFEGVKAFKLINDPKTCEHCSFFEFNTCGVKNS